MSAPRTLEEKQAEKGRLWKAYRYAKREEWRELCEAEPRLIGFRKALRRTHDPRALVHRLADSWLRTAPANVRFAALQQIDRHCWRMAQRSGAQPLDDPMPPTRNVFLAARELLAVR